MKKQFLRKITRLQTELYKGLRIYFLTICTFTSRKIFINDATFKLNIKILEESSNKFEFDNLVYCYMPDHVHLVQIAQSENSDLIKFMKHYKQRSGFHYKKEFKKNLWQKGYYDHIVRKEERIFKIIRYILENPVRKKIVLNYRNYPYSGSLKYGSVVFELPPI